MFASPVRKTSSEERGDTTITRSLVAFAMPVPAPMAGGSVPVSGIHCTPPSNETKMPIRLAVPSAYTTGGTSVPSGVAATAT
jgi:hypothetical protein